MLTRMARLLTRMARMLTRMTRWLAYSTHSPQNKDFGLASHMLLLNSGQIMSATQAKEYKAC